MRVQVETAEVGINAVAVGVVAVGTTASARSVPGVGQQVHLAAGRGQEVQFVGSRGREARLAARRGWEVRDARLNLDRGRDLCLRLGIYGVLDSNIV